MLAYQPMSVRIDNEISVIRNQTAHATQLLSIPRVSVASNAKRSLSWAITSSRLTHRSTHNKLRPTLLVMQQY